MSKTCGRCGSSLEDDFVCAGCGNVPAACKCPVEDGKSLSFIDKLFSKGSLFWRVVLYASLVCMFTVLFLVAKSVFAYQIIPEDPSEQLLITISERLNLSQNETMQFIDLIQNRTIEIYNNTYNSTLLIYENTTIDNREFINRTVIENYTYVVPAQIDPLFVKRIDDLESKFKNLESRPAESTSDIQTLKDIYTMNIIKEAGYDIGPDGKPVPKGVAVPPSSAPAGNVVTADVLDKKLAELGASLAASQPVEDKSYITWMFWIILALVGVSAFLYHRSRSRPVSAVSGGGGLPVSFMTGLKNRDRGESNVDSVSSVKGAVEGSAAASVPQPGRSSPGRGSEDPKAARN